MWKFLKKPFEVFKKLYYRLNMFRHLSKKQYLLIAGGLIFISLTIPRGYAHAEPITLGVIVIAAGVSLLVGVTTSVVGYFVEKLTAATLVMGVISAILLFGRAVLLTGISLFSWAINNPIGLSLTNPATNPIINIGWTLTRDLTNMCFILALAYIGLATALNISGFNTKKTFAKLLLFALLINFTPVIAGVIVDAANITSDFFLSSVDFSELGNIETQVATKGVLSSIKDVAKMVIDPMTYVELFAKLIFFMVTGIILLIFAALFIMRNFIIWFLVILSPLAFFAGIFDFPSAKNIYKKWWKHFISWSFIAVPAGFFLYLAKHFFVGIMGAQSFIGNPGKGVVGSFLNGMAPYLILMMFLGLALYITIKTNAIGSQIIVGTVTKTFGKVKNAPKKLGAIVGAATGSAVGAAAGGVVGGAIAGRQAHIAEGKADNKGFFRRRIGATRAALKGGFSKESRETGRQIAEESREKLYGWAERHHFAPAGTFEEQREKRLNIGEAQKRGQKMSEDKINEQLAVKATQPKHIAEQLGLVRAKIEEKHELTERDKEILVKHSYLDGGKTKWKAMLGPRPEWESVLNPDKAQEKTVERLTGWTKEKREREHKRLIDGGATEQEAQVKIAVKEKATGGQTKAEAETYIEERKNEKLKEEVDKIIHQGELKKEKIDDKFKKKAGKQAELKIRMEAPHIDQDIKIEITQIGLDRMDNKKIGELQVDNLELLMALDSKHIKTLSERATVKQLTRIDTLLTGEKAKGEENELVKRVDLLIERSDDSSLSKQEQDKCLEKAERLQLMKEAVIANPRFLYGGEGTAETSTEAEERRQKVIDEEAEEAEKRRQEEEAAAEKEKETS